VSQRIKIILRWIAVLPAALAAYYGIVLFTILGDLFDGFKWLDFVWKLQCVVFAPLAFVCVGARIAPAHRLATAITLAVIHAMVFAAWFGLTVFCAFALKMTFTEPVSVWWSAIEIVIAVAVTIGACVGIARRQPPSAGELPSPTSPEEEPLPAGELPDPAARPTAIYAITPEFAQYLVETGQVDNEVVEILRKQGLISPELAKSAAAKLFPAPKGPDPTAGGGGESSWIDPELLKEIEVETPEEAAAREAHDRELREKGAKKRAQATPTPAKEEIAPKPAEQAEAVPVEPQPISPATQSGGQPNAVDQGIQAVVSRPRPQPEPGGGWKKIGVNRAGADIFENERGIRSYFLPIGYTADVESAKAFFVVLTDDRALGEEIKSAKRRTAEEQMIEPPASGDSASPVEMELDSTKYGWKSREDFEKDYQKRSNKEAGETRDEFLQRIFCQGRA